MAGYTKLFSSIVHSTIWRAPNHVRLVWVTMLAMSDKNGLVESSVPGLADAARVSLEECEDALKILAAPDPYSRSKDFEGRRIQDADGGWELLNYVKYRGKLKSDTVREQGRLRQQKFRDKQKEREEWLAEIQAKEALKETSRNVTVTHNADITPINAQSESDPSPDPESDPKKEYPPKPPKGAKYSNEFEQFWSAYPKKTGKQAAYRKWKTAKKNGLPPLIELLEILERHKGQDFWKQGKIYKPQNWLGDGHWEDEVNTNSTPQPTMPDLKFGIDGEF